MSGLARRLLALAAAFGAGAAIAAEPRVLALDDLARVAEVAAPVLSPDGAWVVYVVARETPRHDKLASELWLVRYDGAGRVRLTRGEAHDTHPRFSPDGRWIAFLSDRPTRAGGTQVWLIARDGGRPRVLTEFKGGVADFAWAPDARRLAVIAGDDPPDWRDPLDPTAAKRPPAPIVIDRFQFKEDRAGYLTAERRHLYTFELATRRATLLTPGAHDEWFPAWSPDGRTIAYVSKRGADPDRHFAYHIFLIEPVAGAVERPLTDGEASDADPYWESELRFSPDGTELAFLRADEAHWLGYAPWQLAVVDLASGRVRLPAPIDRCFFKPKWSADGRAILALVEERRTIRLSRIELADGAITPLTGGARLDGDFDVVGARLVVLSSDDAHPAEVYALDDTGARDLSAANADWLAGIALQPVEDLEFAGSGGEPVDGYLLRPRGFVAGHRYPTILRVHGGPVWQFYHEFQFDWQLYAARGYAVIAANPHGSSGRGLDYARAIYADWGHRDVADELALVDRAVALGVADPARFGVGGWSYGGILTDYLIASDPRFRAAVSGAGVGDVLAMYGSDEYVREYEHELGTPWQHPEAYLRLSYPFLHADRIRTPTLFLCAERDFNVPCAGAEQMYQALRSLGIATRLVIYPGQYHELDVPAYRRDRLERSLDWYDRHLQAPSAAGTP